MELMSNLKSTRVQSQRGFCYVFCLLLCLTGCSRAEKSSDAPPQALSSDPTTESNFSDDYPNFSTESDAAPAEYSASAEFNAPKFNAPTEYGAAFEPPQAENAQPAKMSFAPMASNARMADDSPRALAPQMRMAEPSWASVAPADAAASADNGPFESLPGGATYSKADGFATVAVYYATDRASNPVPYSSYHVTGARTPVICLVVVAACFGFYAVTTMLRRSSQHHRSHHRVGAFAAIAAIASLGMAVIVLKLGMATIEKQGVTYTGQRGILQRGVATVTVPDSHQRGKIERPSILRFEFREDQEKHVVMTAATEVSSDEFYRRLSTTVSESPESELLVFIHGFNVDFDSAIMRTAQLAVDLPFRGVPVCYSWPSQGQVLGYTVDETNVAWTVHHLKTFLYELAEQSGAKSINLVAHSMGNRALTYALRDISYERGPGTVGEQGPDQAPLFDRIVMAAPDIDADYFRRDLAPRVLKTSNSVTLYASSDDNALIASKQVHGYPRAGESGPQIVIVPGIDTIDVTGIDLSLLGHSYYGDKGEMLQDLFELVHDGLPASQRALLVAREIRGAIYWQLINQSLAGGFAPPVR
jgi:esterase/lipase superfamily enzyme